jgi:hypothetical protein
MIAALGHIGTIMHVNSSHWERLATGVFLVAGVTLDLPTPHARAVGRLDGDLETSDRLFAKGTDRYVGTVAEITAYARALRSLSPGMTAELRVELAGGALPLTVPATWWVRPGPAESANPGDGARRAR